jgi:hypothetical protein
MSKAVLHELNIAIALSISNGVREKGTIFLYYLLIFKWLFSTALLWQFFVFVLQKFLIGVKKILK